MTARRCFWIGHGCFPGLAPFRFGTVAAADAAEARAALAALWRATVPIPAPDFEPQRGLLIFQEEGPP